MPEQSPDWFSGLFLPVTTPFDPETGDIAPVSLRENLRQYAETPIDGIVLFGSTGEGVLVSEEEKLQLIGYARDVLPASLPIIAGVGADSTREVVARIKRIAEGGGVDAVLVHPPPYYAGVLTTGELRDHYRGIADGSPLPIIVYHIPKYTKIFFDAGLVGELARHPNIIGLKDSSGDLKRLAEFSNVCKDACRLFVGNGTLLYTALELGASGGIVAIGCLAPRQCAAIVGHFRDGEPARAGGLQERVGVLHREIVAKYGAPGVKAALDELGYHGGPPRAPLSPLKDKDRRLVAQVVQQAGLH